MKKKILFASVLCLLIFAITFPTAYAYMIKQTDKVKNVMVPPQLSAQVIETFTDNKTKESVKAKNTSNIEAYLRMRIVTYWEDSKGNRVMKSSPVLSDFTAGSGWIAGEDNTYYYTQPLAPGAVTSEFLTAPISLVGVSISVNNVYYDYYPVVEFITEVIQSMPRTVVAEVWPEVKVENNVIVHK